MGGALWYGAGHDGTLGPGRGVWGGFSKPGHSQKESIKMFETSKCSEWVPSLQNGYHSHSVEQLRPILEVGQRGGKRKP